MPPRQTGTIEQHAHRDGRTVSFRLRVRHQGQRYRLTLGTNHEGWSVERAEVELERILGQIERGTWKPPEPEQPQTDVDDDETIHVTLSRWWQSKRTELEDKGREDYEWRISHVLRHLARERTRDMDVRRVDSFRGRLQAAGLGPRATNMVLQLLAMALDDAVDYGLLAANPARGPRRRVRQPKPPRGFLEADMVVDLLDEAGRWEATLPPHQQYGRRPLLALLTLAGPRIEEVLETDRAALDLHAGVLRLGKKTAAGKGRILELSFFLQAELRAHLAHMASIGRPLAPSDPLFATYGRNGTKGRLNASNIRTRLLANEPADGEGRRYKMVTRKGERVRVERAATAVERASDRRASEGRLVLPEKVTPHSLRRTFASLACAAGRDVQWAMGQLGHDDPRMTLGVYAQQLLRRRIDRDLIWLLMRFADEPEIRDNGGSTRVADPVDGRRDS
jgi:integrase